MSSQPETVAGCRMPSDRAIERADRNARIEAEIANEAFVRALRAYFRIGARPERMPVSTRRQITLTKPRAKRKLRRGAWTPEEDDIALSLRARGKTTGQIALRLPGRTDGAVSARLSYLKSREEAGR